MRKLLCVSAIVGLALLVGAAARAADKDNDTVKKELRKRADDFVAAFSNGDAAAVAAFWTEDGDYVDAAGNTLSGRKEIQTAFAKQFAAEKGAKLRVTPKSLRVVKPDLAIEDGETEVLHPGDAPATTTRYTIVHVKQDGQWYLSSVREAVAAPPPNHEHLQELEWLTGDWADEAEKGALARASYSWAEGDHFLVGEVVTTLKDVPVAGATQWIGWDAAAKHVRSWSFDSTGGFTEGAWSKDGDKWTIKTTTTTGEGKKLTATNVITKVDGDHCTWQSTKRALDGKEIPDTEVIKLKRAK